MKVTMGRLLGVAALVVAFGAPARAGILPRGEHILDDYNVDVFRGADTARVAAGLTFGDVYGNGLYWFRGARAGWLQYLDRAPRVRGWLLGGTTGVGIHPEKTVSPVAGLNLDYAFGTSGRIDWQTQVWAGARVKVTPGDEHFAFTFAVYRAAVFGGNGFGDHSDTGIAILYSASRWASR